MASAATARFSNRAERRRSSRLTANVTLVVCGLSAKNKGFQEETSTLSINDHGALVALATEVRLGQRLVVMNPQTWDERTGCVTRLGALEGGRTQVGIEFAELAPEFWPVGAPPKKAFRP